ncbi:hypothetical protein [Streptomyces vinaceus]|uniref:hypothetical protein n=1 Tax=Streptomyces vinaceus TaxID=1960 RepID=UPI0036AFFD48
MGLFDFPPVELSVFEYAEADDGYGGKIPSIGKEHRIRAFVQAIDADDNSSQGWTEPARYKVIARAFPARRWALVRLDGQDFTCSEIPRVHRGSKRTEFVSAVIERRG